MDDDNLKHCLNLLEENEHEIRDEAKRILVELCDNILGYPSDQKYREIKLDHPIITEKLLLTAGAMECLFEIGFVDNDDCLTLPRNAPLAKIRRLQGLLSQSISQKNVSTCEKSRKKEEETVAVKAKPYKPMEFLNEISFKFKDILGFENSALQEKARRLIPISRLQLAATEKLRKLQRQIKMDSSDNESDRYDDDITLESLILIELLNWFKTEFFSWVHSPLCEFCSSSSTFVENIIVSDQQCSRVEVYKCDNCGERVDFPRYIHPEPLLRTRRGRCGEWATVFTLFCISLGYDARLVWDRTDHVWTEVRRMKTINPFGHRSRENGMVWFFSSNRWVHLDPCENVMDRPLMYEKGWGKKLTYIIAYSKDEIQDVTWRYTADQAAVMKRRRLCSENTLITFIWRLNEERQNSGNLSAARKKFVMKRRAMELAEMLLPPPNCKKNDRRNNEEENGETYGGRTSGSLAWRLARGETKDETAEKSHIWKLPEGKNSFHLLYYAARNVYEVYDEKGNLVTEKSSWDEGIEEMEGGIFRKVETDWKQVYLARDPKSSRGSVTWGFQVPDPNTRIASLDFKAIVATFYGVTIEWEIKGFVGTERKIHITFEDSKDISVDDFQGSTKIQITAILTGGKGHIAWQHAQLFRQSISAVKDHVMSIRIKTVPQTNIDLN